MAKGGEQVTKSEVSQSNLPEYARPYFENLMNRANSLFTRDYQPYQDASGNPIERIAGFTPEQTRLQQTILNQQTPGQFGQATNLTNAAGLGSLAAANYATGNFGAQQIGMPNLQQFMMQGPTNVEAQQYGAPQMGAAQTDFRPNLQAFQMGNTRDVGSANIFADEMQGAQSGYRPDLTAFQMGTARDVGARDVYGPMMSAAQTGYRPELQTFQMAPTERVSGINVNAPLMDAAQTSYGSQPLEQFRMDAPEMFGGVQAQRYMSPYIQQALEPQMREAVTSAKRAQIVEDLGAARQGTYGGSRQLLAGMERERNLQQQMGDIQARGMQSAYESAQQQFERDRAAGMTTGQQNLQAALGQQQLGVSTGLQAALANLSNAQQANVNNQAMQFQAQGMSAENAMKAALANQQAGLAAGQQNLAAQLGVQELGAQQGMQAALANLSNEQQARVNNQAMGFQAQGMNAENALRAALANQGVDVTRLQANLQSQLGTQELGAQQALQVAMQNLSNEQQARVNNQAQAFQAQGMNAENALRAALANQGVDVTRAQANQQAALGVQQLGAQTGLQAALANLDARQQANVQNLAAQLQTQGLNSEQAMRAALANQQMGFNVGQQNLQSLLQTQQLGTNAGLEALRANQQADLERQRMMEQSRQFGAQNRLSAYGQLGQMGQTLSNIGSAQSQADQARFGLQTQTAAQRQALEQQRMDQQYQDFLRQNNYDLEMLQLYGGLMRGVPIETSATRTLSSPAPSVANQLLSTGLGGLSMYNMANRAGVI